MSPTALASWNQRAGILTSRLPRCWTQTSSPPWDSNAATYCSATAFQTRLNPNQIKAIRREYDPLIDRYGLNPVTIPKRPNIFCDDVRANEITEELVRSETELLVLLGDIPVAQFLCRVSNVPYGSLREYVDLFGYGNRSEATISGKTLQVLPLAHPRQIGALGLHSERWFMTHQEWERTALRGREM